MRTLDIMKFTMMMETTTGSSWLTGLMPLKSFFSKSDRRETSLQGRVNKVNVDVPNSV